MISTLELKQFRGLEHVKFEKLGRANLIIGGNDTGKTSVLEALVLLYGSEEQAGGLPTTFRTLPKGSDVATDWKYLGRNGEPSQMELIADNDKIKGDIRTVWRGDATFDRSYDLPGIAVLAFGVSIIDLLVRSKQIPPHGMGTHATFGRHRQPAGYRGRRG